MQVFAKRDKKPELYWKKMMSPSKAFVDKFGKHKESVNVCTQNFLLPKHTWNRAWCCKQCSSSCPTSAVPLQWSCSLLLLIVTPTDGHGALRMFIYKHLIILFTVAVM